MQRQRKPTTLAGLRALEAFPSRSIARLLRRRTRFCASPFLGGLTSWPFGRRRPLRAETMTTGVIERGQWARGVDCRGLPRAGDSFGAGRVRLPPRGGLLRGCVARFLRSAIRPLSRRSGCGSGGLARCGGPGLRGRCDFRRLDGFLSSSALRRPGFRLRNSQNTAHIFLR